ncbi:MAG: GAF domain-containing protein [Deltaproteobacteria bacterium]|nr:GAF domain-containing protein [Deltaproteobacteria bacterium]
MKLRSHLIILVVAALLPVLIFASVIIAVFDKQQRATVENRLVDTTRALSLAVDREVAAWASTLQALGSSKHLDSGNLSAFRVEAARVLKTRKDWNNILLTDSESRQLLNLFLPLGSPLPSVGDLEQFQQVIKSSQPVASDLFLGRVSRKHLVGVAVPVVRNGKVRFVLASSTSPNSLLQILAQQDIPPEWLGTIIDRKGIIIARTRNIEKSTGNPAMSLRDAPSGDVQEGLGRGVTEDGTEVQVTFHRSALTGWTVRLAIPVSVLEAPLRRSLWFTVVGGLALLIVGIVLAIGFGQRIAKPITDLSLWAETLRGGERSRLKTSPIAEVNRLAQVLQDATVTRNRIEETLQEQSRLLDLYFKYALNPVVFLDRDFNFIRVNEAYARACQRDVNDFPGHNYFEFYPSDAKVIFEEVVKTKKPFQALARPFAFPDHPEWEVTYWDWTLVPILDSTGEVELFVFSLNDVTERKKAEKETQRRLESIRTLHAVAATANQSLDLEVVLNQSLERALEVLQLDAGQIYLTDPLTQTVRLRAHQGIGAESPQALSRRLGEGIMGQVANGEHAVSEDIQTDPYYLRLSGQERMPAAASRANVSTPIKARGKTIGVLNLASYQPRRFSSEELELATSIADVIGVAAENARLYEETKRSLERIRVLNEINLAISTSLDLQTVLDMLLEKTSLLIPHAASEIRLLNKETGILEPTACRNINEKEWKALKAGRGLVKIVLEAKAPLMVLNAPADPRSANPDFFRKEGLVSFLGVPLVAKEEPLGVLVILTREEHEFSAEEVELFSTLAAQAAIAIYNSQIYEQTRKQAKELLSSRQRLRALTARVISSREEEARRIARELHDEAGQLLASVYLAVDEISRQVQPPVKEDLQRVTWLLDQIEEQLRSLAHELRPTILDDLGLLPAIQSLAQRFSKRTGMDIALEEVPKRRLPPAIETALYRTVQEALNNVTKHAQATAVRVQIQQEDGMVRCLVLDNGIGFDVPAVLSRSGAENLGFIGIRERVETLNGKLQIQSAPGQGTQLCVTIPLGE